MDKLIEKKDQVKSLWPLYFGLQTYYKKNYKKKQKGIFYLEQNLKTFFFEL